MQMSDHDSHDPYSAPLGRVLALDVGTKRIGLALSDETRLLSQPLKTLRRQSPPEDVRAISDVVKEWDVREIVLGLPLHMNGDLGEMGKKVLAFRDLLQTKINIPIETWDERLTTAEAERLMIEGGARRDKRKEVIDQIAASLILKGYLAFREKNPR